MKKLERKVQKLRRIAVIGIAFSIGFLLNGVVPFWAKVVFPAAYLLWLMAYDDAMYEIHEKKATTPASVSRKEK